MSLKSFFQFPVIEEQGKDLQVRWVTNPRLQQQMRQRQRQTPQEAHLVRELFTEFQQNPQNLQIKQHWIAFLSSFSWSVAWKIQKDLKGAGLDSSQVDLKESFQLALTYAFNPIQFFQKFDSDREEELWYLSLKAYARKKIEGQLIDYIRSQVFKTFKRSSLGLAARATKKRVKDALTWQGHQSPLRECYVLAWQCFDEASKAKAINIASPQREQFQAIADRYNERRAKLSFGTNDHLSLNGQQIEDWLKEIGEIIRRYIDQPITSLNKVQSENTDSSLLDNVVDNSSTVDVESLEVTEQQELLNQFLSRQLTNLDPERKKLLFLRYGLELKQTIIAQKLATKQAKISERCSQFIKNLRESLIREKWLGIDESLILTSEVLKVLKDNLEEMLKNYYQDWFVFQIKNACQQYSQLYQHFLNSEYDLLLKHDEETVSLISLLHLEIQTQFQVSLNNQEEAKQSLIDKIEECLPVVTYNLKS